MAMRSGWVRLTVSTMRWAWARPSTGPRWTSLTTAIRKPCAARGSLARGTWTRFTLGPRSTPYAPFPTVPRATAAAAPPTVRATKVRRLSPPPGAAAAAPRPAPSAASTAPGSTPAPAPALADDDAWAVAVPDSGVPAE